MRKPRSDAKLLTLPDEDQRALYENLRDGMSYDKARIWVRKEYEIKTSTGALHDFWSHYSEQEQSNRWLQAITAAKDIEREAAENLPLLDKAAMAALTQAGFEAALRGDPKATKVFMSVVLKAKQQGLDAKKIELMERRMKQAEEAEKVVQEDIPPEQRDKRLKEIFGLA